MDSNNIYKKIQNYVTGLFEKKYDSNLIFHDLQHTKNVVSRVKEIAAHYNVSEKDMLVLFVAAWFHDTGYLFVEPSMHEENSVEQMKKFMSDYYNDPEMITETENCILSTKPHVNPGNLLQQILCDADTYHLGTKEFKDTNKQVMQ